MKNKYNLIIAILVAFLMATIITGFDLTENKKHDDDNDNDDYDYDNYGNGSGNTVTKQMATGNKKLGAKWTHHDEETELRGIDAGLVINCRPASTDWDKIYPLNKSATHFRTGGSVAMWSYNTIDDAPIELHSQRNLQIYTDKKIDDFANAVHAHDVKIMHTVNINDTLENSLLLAERMLERDIEISHIILGNELYLRKFLPEFPDHIGLGFVRKWSPEEYAALVLEWSKAFRNLISDVKIVVSGAAMTGRSIDTARQRHNVTLIQLLADNPGCFDGWDIHVYIGNKEGSTEEEEPTDLALSSLDYLPGFLVFGETGHYNVNNTENGLELYKIFNLEGIRYCRDRNDGSIWGFHVLYNKNIGQAPHFTLYNWNGITYLGDFHNMFFYQQTKKSPTTETEESPSANETEELPTTETGYKDENEDENEDENDKADHPDDIMFGDVTGDGKITVGDVIVILRYIVGLEKLDEEQKVRADISGSGNITVQDAIMILRKIVGLVPPIM